MDAKSIGTKLEEVKAMKLPCMTYQKVKEYYGGLPGFIETEENIKCMDEYLSAFLDPKNEYCSNGCWICGESMSINWGLSHGIAYSNCCGMTYKCYHYPDSIKPGIFTNRLERAFQYHPDGFSIGVDDNE